MALRPNATSPGRTYKWYTGTPVYEFGHGLHYTTFKLSWKSSPSKRYNIASLTGKATNPKDLAPFDTFEVEVQNTGHVTSDYVALLFVSGNGGPTPHPNKQLVAYTRLHDINARGGSTASLPVTLGSIARTDENGNLWVYPGTYTLTVDTPGALSATFELEGDAVQISTFPQNSWMIWTIRS